MKKIIFFFTVLFIFSISFAQKSTSKKVLPADEEISKQLIKELKLNPQQSKDLKISLKQSFDEADNVRTNSAISKDDRKKQLSVIYKAREEKILSILDNNQKAKYEALKIEKKKAHNKK